MPLLDWVFSAIKTNFERVKLMKKTDTERASELLKDLKYNLFTPEFVSDEEAEILYHTILFWRSNSNAYFDMLENE